MARPDDGAEWLLLSTAVVRMSELDFRYRNYPGRARLDLETAIRAGRLVLRGRSWALDHPPELITAPVSSEHQLDLIRNTLGERRRSPSGNYILFWEVEVEWNGAATYLRPLAAESWKVAKVIAPRPAGSTGVGMPAAGRRARGGRPKKLEATKEAMRSQMQIGTLTVDCLTNMLEKQMQERFGVSRTTCREARKAILSESEFAGNSIRDK